MVMSSLPEAVGREGLRSPPLAKSPVERTKIRKGVFTRMGKKGRRRRVVPAQGTLQFR